MAHTKAKKIFTDTLKSDHAYGVAVKVVTAEDLEALAPANLTAEKLWLRAFEALSAPEQSFLQDIVEQFHTAHADQTAAHPLQREKMRNMIAKGIYSELKNTRLTNKGASFTITAPLMKNEFAPEVGEDAYVERSSAIIVLRTHATPADIVRTVLSMDPADVIFPDIDPDAWNYFTLEHERAHCAGADEAQADMIATAHYIRAFGTDDVPKLWEKLRGVSAVLDAMHGVATVLAPKMLSPEQLQSAGLATHQQRQVKLYNIQRYGWGPVTGLKKQLALGIEGNKSLTSNDIHALRFADIDTKSEKLMNLAATLIDSNPSINPFNPDLKELIATAKNILPQLKSEADEAQSPIDKETVMLTEDFIRYADDVLGTGPKAQNKANPPSPKPS